MSSRGARGNGPVHLSKSIGEITEELRAAPLTALTAVETRLDELLDAETRSAVRVRSLVDGELVLEVADTRTASELGYQRDVLREGLADPSVQGAVRRIRVVVRRSG